MAETLLEVDDPIPGPDGGAYLARVVGAEMPDGLWQGWIEFEPVGGGEPVRTGRETTQPNQVDTVYWATGLSQIYLQGALTRALAPEVKVKSRRVKPPAFAEPAPRAASPSGAMENGRAVLDPFYVYEKNGEEMLRKQLNALSAWHLVNIALDFQLSQESRVALSTLPEGALIDLIVNGVRTAKQPR